MFILWQCLWPSRPIVQRSVDYWVLSVVFKVVLQHSGLNIQKWPPRRSSHQYLPKHMTNVNDHVWIRNQSRNLHLMHRPHQSYAGFYWHGRQRSVLVSASPCNGFLPPAGGQLKWISISGCFGQVPGHHVPNCPQQEMLRNMKQSGKGPALKEALNERSALLSHWHKCNTMKPFIYQRKLSQWRMTNAFYIQSHLSKQFIHRDSTSRDFCIKEGNLIIWLPY